MKIETTKEWCEKSAEIEGEAEVGCGMFVDNRAFSFAKNCGHQWMRFVGIPCEDFVLADSNQGKLILVDILQCAVTGAVKYEPTKLKDFPL